jgi:sulfate/thiosulfate transport system substrate-binding protein
MRLRFHSRLLGCAALVAIVASACATSNASTQGRKNCKTASTPVVTLAAYSNVYDVYGKLISAFQDKYKEEHAGKSVIFQTSFGGSTTQAQNVVNGFKADVVALSLAPDVDLIKKAGLITQDWTAAPDQGVVATSAVVFDVRPGNPKHIEDWGDLTQPGLEILTPDPTQSGGAKWNIVAAYGAAMRGKVPGYTADNPADAERLLTGIFNNVTVLDKSANDSIKSFQAGNGDVAITYEYAVLLGQKAGGQDEMVIPPSTVSIQTPVAVVDKNAQADCVLDVANEFVSFVHSSDAQDVYSSVGLLRPIDVAAAQQGDGDKFAAIQDLFTTDDFGGWNALIDNTVFGPNGAFTKALKAATS